MQHRFKTANRRPRPWLLLWLLPMLWAGIDSGVHDPDGCICHKVSESASHTRTSAKAAHSPHESFVVASHAAADDDCLECQWISAAAFAVPAVAAVHIRTVELPALPQATYRLVSTSRLTASSRGPPDC